MREFEKTIVQYHMQQIWEALENIKDVDEPSDLLEKINRRIATPRQKLIPMRQLAVAASLLICLFGAELILFMQHNMLEKTTQMEILPEILNHFYYE